MTRTFSMLALCAAGAFFAGGADADTSKMKIAFSNNYAGNSWRQAMLKSYDIVTKQAVKDGVVAAADVFTTADKEVPTQAAQIQNLILQGYNAIVINAASPDALNGAIKQACDAGIVVVSFDGIVTEPCAWRVVVDFNDYGKQEIEHMAKFQPKGGNLLEIRGLAGTSIDDAIHSGIDEGVKAHPEFKIVVVRHRRLGPDDRAEGGRDRAAVAAADRRRRRPGRRRLWRRPGLHRRRQAASDDYDGQSPGRIAVVEGAEGQERLHHLVRHDRAGHLDPCLLGRSAGPGRQQEHPARPPGALSPGHPGYSRQQYCRRSRKAASPTKNTPRPTGSPPSRRT